MTRPSRLAADGGTPVRRRLLPYGRHVVEEEDIAAVVQVLRSDWLTTGPMVARFEETFAERVGARFAVSFSSGTAALHGAAHAAGLGPGDEAVTTPMTFCATANCVLYVGASPVFADVRPDTLNLDPAAAEARLSPRTKALIVVDYAGHPADMDAFGELARRKGLVLIEDACHALGASYRGRLVGGLADMTIFSFHPVKHITTGEGGMVTTNDGSLARKLRVFRNHGIDSDARERQSRGDWRYDMTELGFNYRLSDIACALGLSQLARLKTNIENRQRIASRYDEAFRDVPGLKLPAARTEVGHARHIYPLRVDPRTSGVGRDVLFSELRAEGIGVNVHYIPVHFHPYYRDRLGHKAGECPVAEAAYGELITLPLFNGMLSRDVQDVIKAVNKVVSHHAPGGVS